MAAARQFFSHLTCQTGRCWFSSRRLGSVRRLAFCPQQLSSGVFRISACRVGTFPTKASGDNISAAPESDDDGVSLGTLKLPANTDLARFESLLFQWANSLCQGANVPLPVPLKVDRIEGGARLGFITIEDNGKTNVKVYIDCIVTPATGSSSPLFRAIRNGPSKDKAPPGEPRIMRSLLQALQKSVEIART